MDRCANLIFMAMLKDRNTSIVAMASMCIYAEVPVARPLDCLEFFGVVVQRHACFCLLNICEKEGSREVGRSWGFFR